MGTSSVELALPELVEILSPGGKYEVGRLALRKEYGVVLENSKKVTAIESAEAAQEATGFGRLLQSAVAETEKFYKPFKAQIDDIKKPILSAEHDDRDAYDLEKKRLGVMLTGWNKRVREEQEKADQIAREEALKKAQEELLLRAAEVETLEGTEAAMEILNEPLYVAPVVTQSLMPNKPKGSVSSATYRCKVTDLMLLVKAVAEGRAPLQALQANESFLHNQARQFREAFYIPGCVLDKSDNTEFRR